MDIYYGTDRQDGAPGAPGQPGTTPLPAPGFIVPVDQSYFTARNLNLQAKFIAGKGGNGGIGGLYAPDGNGGIGGHAQVSVGNISGVGAFIEVYGGLGGNGSNGGRGGRADFAFADNILTDSGSGSTWSDLHLYVESGKTGNGGDVGSEATLSVVRNTFLGNANDENLKFSIGAKGMSSLIHVNNNLFDGGAGIDTLTLALTQYTLSPNQLHIGTVVVDLAAGLFSLGGEDNTIHNFENITIAAPVLSGTPMFQTVITGDSGNNALAGNPIGPNTLSGGGGDDTLTGGSGDDTYFADASDTVTEATGGGTDTVNATGNYVLPDNVENLVLGLNSQTAYGNTLDNHIYANGAPTGGQYIDGGTGADTIEAYGASDTYVVDNAGDVIIAHGYLGTVVAAVSYSLSDNISDIRSSVAGDIDLTGNAIANHLDGSAGKNRLDGGLGADTMTGYAGNDTYIVDNVGDVVAETANGGTDTVLAGVSYNLTADIETLILSGTGNFAGTGNGLNNTITGNAGDNLLDGGAGADTLAGGGGNDVYTVDSLSDVVTENAGEGTDTVNSAVTWTLVNIENLILTGSGAISGTGNAAANSMSGNGAANTLNGMAGNDTLNGGAGSDKLYGGLGDDVYYIDSKGDHAYENSGEGYDVVYAAVTFTLDINVEALILTGAAANGSGNDLANALTGNDLANMLYGFAGNDVLDGGLAKDSLYGGVGDDTYMVDNSGDQIFEYVAEGHDVVNSTASFGLSDFAEDLNLLGSAVSGTGNAQANRITGNAARNLLDGGLGADTLIGGLGDDTYGVDSASDVITENANEGTDTVQASITYSLAANFENLSLTGSDAINGTGTELNNVIIGNAGANSLFGQGGNDVLDGGVGGDKMYGGAGNDTYNVDSTLDRAYEYLKPNVDSGGHDLVNSSVSFTLFPFVEDLTLTGTAAVKGTGNELDNVMTGNSAANILSALAGNDQLDGGGGADKMYGGIGNDTYYVDSTSDLIFEFDGEGTDIAYATASFTLGDYVETLVLTGTASINGAGSAQNNTVLGNSGANKLYGYGGNDWLDGGAGADRLYGGLGDDTFTIDNAGDHIYENNAEGHDLARSSVRYTLEAFVDDLLLTGTLAINGAGNELDNRLTGNSAANKLYGIGGDDILDGGVGPDSMYGGIGNDTYIVDTLSDRVYENSGEGIDQITAGVSVTLVDHVENLLLTGSMALTGKGNGLDNALTGNGGGNILYGLDGNDVLDGAVGADTVYGGTGDDTYFVDNAADRTIELIGEGHDVIRSTVNWSMADAIEDLQLSGSGDISGTGNGLDNILTGNGGANILYGLGGNDVLDGGSGADTVYGGTGNDTYMVDNVADQTIESDGQGRDLVRSAINWTLADYVEDLQLTGNGNVSGTGNTLDNLLTGNSGGNILYGLGGNDVLDGDAGVDTLYGGSGDDTYVVDSFSDVVIETGADLNFNSHNLVLSSYSYQLSDYVQNLTLTGNGAVDGVGNTLNNRLTGNNAGNVLFGYAGDDILIGGGGNDQLDGGQGQDTFVFEAAAVNGIDSIFGFTSGEDRLSFKLSDGFPFQPNHLLTDEEYSVTGTPSGLSPQFVYDPGSHALYWSAGGTMIEIAVFMNMAQPAKEDFLFT